MSTRRLWLQILLKTKLFFAQAKIEPCLRPHQKTRHQNSLPCCLSLEKKISLGFVLNTLQVKKKSRKPEKEKIDWSIVLVIRKQLLCWSLLQTATKLTNSSLKKIKKKERERGLRLMSVSIFYYVTAELGCVFLVLKGLRDSYFLWVDLMLNNINIHGDDSSFFF